MNDDRIPAANPSTPNRETPGKGRERWMRLWPVGLLALGLATLWLAGLGDYLTLDFIIREHAYLATYVNEHLTLAVLTYLALYTVAVAVSFPGASLLTIAGGYLFGAVLGTALTVFAATVGATIIFLAARTSFGAFLREKVDHFAGRFAKGFEENAFSYLFLLRLVPLFPFWLINIVPTLFDVSVRTYVIATALGIIPGTLAYVLLGDGLGATVTTLEAQNPGCAEAGTCDIGLGLLLTPGPLIAMAALCIVAVIPLVVKKLRARQEQAS